MYMYMLKFILSMENQYFITVTMLFIQGWCYDTSDEQLRILLSKKLKTIGSFWVKSRLDCQNDHIPQRDCSHHKKEPQSIRVLVCSIWKWELEPSSIFPTYCANINNTIRIVCYDSLVAAFVWKNNQRPVVQLIGITYSSNYRL